MGANRGRVAELQSTRSKAAQVGRSIRPALDFESAAKINLKLRMYEQLHVIDHRDISHLGELARSLFQVIPRSATDCSAGGRQDCIRMLGLFQIILELSVLQGRTDLEPALQCIHILAVALKDLDEGVVMPLLRPTKLRGRAKDSRYVSFVKGIAAMACDVLIKTCALSNGEAGRKVASTINRNKILRRGRPVGGHTILKWRQSRKLELDLAGIFFKDAVKIALADGSLAVAAKSVISDLEGGLLEAAEQHFDGRW